MSHQVVLITITNSYTLFANIPATFTIKNRGGGSLLFNTVNTDDDAAIPLHSNNPQKQIVQVATVDTYIRHTGPAGEDWVLILDENSDNILFVLLDGIEILLDGEPVQLV